MNKKYIIYKHTNKIDGKVYIGKTSLRLARRCDNGNGYKHCSRFWDSIQKYGWDNFEHEILYENLSEQEADTIEQELIREYNSTNPKYGYNIDYGGNRQKCRKETKEKISNTLSSANNPNCKSVRCIETNMIYYSVRNACANTKIESSSIVKCCRKKYKTAGGYHWEYVDNEKQN